MATQQGQYECRSCGASFSTREQLEQHNRQMHGTS